MTESKYSIYAFISYSRKDKKIANWLHAKLESFQYPENVADAAKPPHHKYVRPVFIDTKDLKVEERPFDEGIKEHIRRSRYLIVVCSKNSAISPYVDMEIRYFLETHDCNYSLIVPVFIDEVDHSIPPAFDGTSIMSRHFPIYNTMLGGSSEANQYAFLQLASYMLDINFSDVYNRYEKDNEKKHRRQIRKYILAFVFAVLCILGLISYVAKQRQVIEKDSQIIKAGNELVEFEREVFPSAVVFGYEANFLTPVIRFLKEKRGNDFRICVFLPKTEKELRQHQDRIVNTALMLQEKIGIDSLTNRRLDTEMRRGSRVIYLVDKGEVVENIILDFATVTSSFLQVALHKQSHPVYENIPLNDMIEEYSEAFIRKTNHCLESDSVYVEFFMNPTDFVTYYRSNYPNKQ